MVARSFITLVCLPGGPDRLGNSIAQEPATGQDNRVRKTATPTAAGRWWPGRVRG
jgi:hypothetical protein